MQGKRLTDSQHLLSKRSHKRERRAETCMQRPRGLPGGRGEKVRCISHPCSPRRTGLDRRPAAQRLVLRNRICNTKWSFFQPVSLEKLRPEHPAEVKGRFWSARGGGPGLGRTDPRSWEGAEGNPGQWRLFCLSLTHGRRPMWISSALPRLPRWC